MRATNPPRTGPMEMEFRHISLGHRLACVWNYIALGIFSHGLYHFNSSEPIINLTENPRMRSYGNKWLIEAGNSEAASPEGCPQSCSCQGRRAVAWQGSSLSGRFLHTLLGRWNRRGLGEEEVPLSSHSVTLWQLNGLGLGLGAGKAALGNTEEGTEWFKVCQPRIASAPHHLWAIKHQQCKQLSSEQ